MSAPSRGDTIVIDGDSDSGSDAPTSYTINGRVYSAQNTNSNNNNNNETTANAQQQSNVQGQQHSSVSTANNNSNSNTLGGQQNVDTPARVRFNETLQFSDPVPYGGTNGNNNNNGNVSTDNNNNNNNNNAVQGQQNVNASTPTRAARTAFLFQGKRGQW